MIEWSPQQEGAIKAAQAWLKNPNGPQVFHIFGYAGTGKTTLAKEIAQNVKRRDNSAPPRAAQKVTIVQ